MFTLSRLAVQYWIVDWMDWRIPLGVVDRLQISSAKCMDGTGREVLELRWSAFSFKYED